MKYRLLHIAFLILYWSGCLTSIAQEEVSPESLMQNLSIPGGSITDGINPEDIIFADNKFFVAGLGTVLVLNTDFDVINTINLSERGQYGYDAFTIIKNLPSHNLMAFNGNNKLFVLSPDNEICVINTSGSGTLETTRIPRPSAVPLYEFSRSIIRYDYVNQRVFWVISWDYEHIGKSYLGWYDANSYVKIWDNNSNLFSGNNIYDIVINKLANYFYLARVNTIEVCESNTNYFHVVKTISCESNHKELLYIQTNELHSVFCCTWDETPSPNIYWIDGNNFNSSGSFPAPAATLHGMAYIPSPINELIFGGAFNVYIYNGISHQLLSTITLPNSGEDISNLEAFNNTIYISMPSKIYSINTQHQVNDILTKQNNYFGRVACSNSGDILITNMAGASIEIFNHQGIHENLLTGVSVYKSCYNPTNQKVYFYSDELRDDGKIVIIKHDEVDNSYNINSIIGTQANISACSYNEVANHLLFSSYSETNKIIKRNGSNNGDAGYFTLANEFCENIFITPPPDNKIYCATAMNSLSEASIEIYNAQDYTRQTILDHLGSGYDDYEFRTEFSYNSRDNDIYFLLFPRTNALSYGKIIRIDPDNGYSIYPYTLTANPEKIIYSEISNKIYIKYRQENFITQFDCNNLSNPLSDQYFDYTVKDIDYGKHFNTLYVLTASDSQEFLDYIYGHSCYLPIREDWHWWEAPAYSESIKYNDLNQRIYVFSPYVINSNFESHLTIFDHPVKMDPVDLYLHNSQCTRFADPTLFNHLTVDPVNGYILIPNGSHSNISVIRCPERFELTKKINWISFPRLDRNPQDDAGTNSVEALTDRIVPGPWFSYTGHMYHLAFDSVNPQVGNMTSIDKATYTSPWDPSNELFEVHSNRGYQLQVDPDKKFIYFYGQVQDPSVLVELEGTREHRFSNWVGYYLTFPQNPFDAIPTNILENLRFMAGQYWSCVFDDPLPDNAGPGCWKCAINQGRLEINYGDMVKLTSVSSNSFTWQQSNSNGPSIEKLKAQSFAFIEQYNYDAIFIELDSNDLPSEIGAFAGDSCVGATKVLPGDTTVLICAYTEGYEGEDITFEFSYNTKAARTDKLDYFVQNPRTGKSEQRLIKAGENQPYHFVSFKSKEESLINPVSTEINCYPNPATDAFRISYYLPEDGKVKLEILSPLGIKVLEKQLGYQTEGNQSCDIQTVGLPIGYYYVRIYTADRYYVGTLLLNH